MKTLNIVLLGFSVALAAIVVVLVSGQVTQLSQYHADLDQQLNRSELQPYGGCDEAFRYPGTAGFKWCERNGYFE